MKMTKMDWGWVLTCFGTAVGAGILFLPIRAGLGGIWATILLTLIIFPITYVAHRGITRIVASCPNAHDIVEAVEYDLGPRWSFAVSILYFLSIITICVGYATGITNTVSSFMTHQLGMGPVARPLLTFLLLAGLTTVMLFNEKVMVTITSILTFPLIGLLVIISIYMIPHWNLSVFQEPFVFSDVAKNILLLFPVLVFAMNFSPVCSSLGAFYGKTYPDKAQAVQRSDNVIKWTSLILLIFVMFFVFSMVLAGSREMFAGAKDLNVDTLTSMSLAFNKPFIVWFGPIIALLAISSSYFGHFTGTREGLIGIYTRLVTWNDPAKKDTLNMKKIKLVFTGLLFVGLWFLAVYNPPILKIIGAISAPIIAFYAYLMPVILMRKVPRLFIYRSPIGGLVFIMGLIGIVGDFVATYIM